MCDPVIAGGAMLAMSGIQAYTQYQQGKYASKVAEANADIATAQANDAINRGNAEAEQRRRETRQRLGTQAATMGATGADLSTVTNGAIVIHTQRLKSDPGGNLLS